MQALTVRQPYAWAIAHAGKTIENRSWSTSYRGLLAIHAALTFDQVGARSQQMLRAWGTWWLDRPRKGTQLPKLTPDAQYIERGAFVAVAQLIEVHLAADNCCWGWGEHPAVGDRELFHWQLTGIVPLSTPVLATGRQGLWTPTDQQLKALTEAAAQ
ncbi:MAG: ASCH domain-containing protein [Catenulispora sp.]|nr:ASCH domain-containing protein [Catenulispora sp.]NUT39980.1 ASCH domain-containing protein [Thermoactinospora sp.]